MTQALSSAGCVFGYFNVLMAFFISLAAVSRIWCFTLGTHLLLTVEVMNNFGYSGMEGDHIWLSIQLSNDNTLFKVFLQFSFHTFETVWILCVFCHCPSKLSCCSLLIVILLHSLLHSGLPLLKPDPLACHSIAYILVLCNSGMA